MNVKSRNWKTFAALGVLSFSVMAMAAGTGNRAVTKNEQSPNAETSAMVAGKNVTIEYNAPSARGRSVEGGLIPYGKWWRLGADTSTTLTADTDLKIGTLTVPKGIYSLYLIANDEKTWQLIVNKQTKQWGTEYNAPQDLGRTALKLTKSPDMVETLKISLKPAGANAATLDISWGHTIASVAVKGS